MDYRLAYDLVTDFDPTERIRADTLALADDAEGNLAAPVPGCPGWSVADLAWHLLEVQYFWGWIVGGRRQDTEGYLEPPRPADPDLLTGLRAGVGHLVGTLRAAGPAEPVFSWASRKDVGWVVRHQVQEAAVHRWDAGSAAGRDVPLDADAAIDGVEEFLRYGAQFRAKGAAAVGGPVALVVADTGHRWLVDEDTDGSVRRRRGSGEAAAVLTAPASDLLLYLYRRKSPHDLLCTGDIGAAERFALRSSTD